MKTCTLLLVVVSNLYSYSYSHQLDDLEEDYKIATSEPAQSALANLLELKQQVEESIKVNHLVEFKDKQVTDIDSKMQELNKSMEFRMPYFLFNYCIFDSLAQVLNQIKIDVIVSERESKNSFNYFNTPCDSISSTVCIPSIGTQPKPLCDHLQ